MRDRTVDRNIEKKGFLFTFITMIKPIIYPS